MTDQEKASPFVLIMRGELQRLQTCLPAMQDSLNRDLHLIDLLIKGLIQNWDYQAPYEDDSDYIDRCNSLEWCLACLMSVDSVIPQQESFVVLTLLTISMEKKLYSFLSLLHQEEFSELFAQFTDFFEGPGDQYSKKEVLNYIFANDTRHLAESFSDSEEDLPDDIYEHAFFSLLSTLLLKYPGLGIQTAIILTKLPALKSSDVIRRMSFTTEDTAASFELDSKGFYFCSDAEQRIIESLDSGKFMVVINESNEVLMVIKFVGRLTAIVLKDFITKSGHFVPKNTMITPVSEDIRRQLYKLQHTGVKIIRSNQITDLWEYSRAVDYSNFDDKSTKSLEEILEEIKVRAYSLSHTSTNRARVDALIKKIKGIFF